MDSSQARSLIRETFMQAFDKGRFQDFIRELLNHIDESKARHWNKTYVKDAFKPRVNRFERLATYTAPNGEKLDVLIVHLERQSSLERARTSLRNFAADYLSKRGAKEAALVAFVSPTEKQWRFSYVKMEYAAVEKESGKVGVETQLSPARRFSYLVGEGESCHTAQSRLAPLLVKDSDCLLGEIEKAFSVEAVTKEFFKFYAELFTRISASLEKLTAKDKTIRDEFKNRNVSTLDFAKKLMGQVVFLYFLQKKGWLGVEKGKDWGTGPHDFLRRLADGKYRSYDNFVNDVLEPLFYDTLATDRGHEAWCKTFNCRIPFLNGGLFEPLGDYDWRNTDISIPNKLFTNTERTEVGDIGSGMLDVFDRYNFTVNEAEPLEKEVAIDPEMLGKVFENLIEENRRKGLGSYYTPREIVHYMCQESLINYLDTALNTREESLALTKPKQTKLIGGAEPEQIEMTTTAPHELVPRADLETFVQLGDQISHYEAVETRYAVKMSKSIEKNARLIDQKLADITVCDPAVGSGAFPVGMMAEIVRARSALTPYFNDVHERTPYHFKRHAIQNSLYGVDIDPGAVEIAKLRLWLSLVVDEEDVKQIKPLPNLFYKVVAGNSLLGVEKNLFNQQLFRRLEELKPYYFDEPDKDKKDRYKQQIEDTIHELTNGKEAFDFEIYFSEVFHRKKGFDVVIANPPYVRQEKIKELKPALRAAGYECFSGTADLLVYFYERSVKLLRPGGALALITSNKYYRAGYGKALRGFLPRELTLHRLIDFGDAPVFEAIAYASILTGTRTAPAKDAAVTGYTWEQELSLDRITQIVSERGQNIFQSELRIDGWQLESPVLIQLLEKLRKAGKPLGEYVNGCFYNGVKSGHTKAFVVDRKTRDRLIKEHKSSAKLFKPYFAGRDLKRWRINSRDLWLIYVPWHFPFHENQRITAASTEAEKEFKKLYPAIYEHLEQFKDELAERDKAETGIRYEWYAMARPRFEIHKAFEQPKIVLARFMNKPTYAFDKEGFYHNDAQYLIGGANSYLVGILNSNVCWWFLTQTCTDLQNGYLQALIEYQVQIPIPAASPEKQKAVERLVDRVLAAKQRDADADVSAWEREIDQLVYALYGLTQEEIQIVEGAV